MADILPPPPHDQPQTSFAWVDWWTKLRRVINTSALDHNSLTGIQGGTGGEYYHITNVQLGKVNNAEQTTSKNSANGYAGLNAVSRTTKGVDSTDDLIVDDAAKGLVLKNGSNYYRVTVNGSGVLVVTNLGTTKP